LLLYAAAVGITDILLKKGSIAHGRVTVRKPECGNTALLEAENSIITI